MTTITKRFTDPTNSCWDIEVQSAPERNILDTYNAYNGQNDYQSFVAYLTTNNVPLLTL